jgi:hypothetical protein
MPTSGGFDAPESPGRQRALVIGIVAITLMLMAGFALVIGLGSAPPPALEIISSPTGAQVSIDGRTVPGVTPLTITEGIESGTAYRVQVTMPGYQPWAAQLTPAGGTLRQFVVLAPMPATLRVETDPPGAQAEIHVNGTPRGPAPIEVSGFLVGQEVEIRANVPGRPQVIRRVRLGQGTTTERISIASP